MLLDVLQPKLPAIYNISFGKQDKSYVYGEKQYTYIYLCKEIVGEFTTSFFHPLCHYA